MSDKTEKPRPTLGQIIDNLRPDTDPAHADVMERAEKAVIILISPGEFPEVTIQTVGPPGTSASPSWSATSN